MTLNATNLDARGMRDPSKCAGLLGELSKLCVNVTAVQENHFNCAENLSGAGGRLCSLFSIR